MVLAKRVLLLTGAPSVGKTTVLMKAVNALKERGICIGGMLSREARAGGKRVGFEILDLSSGRSGRLAHLNQKTGPRVGRYHVNLYDLELIGAIAIADAVENCDVIAIDEIGPMELFSKKFKEVVRKALENHKPVLAIVHWKANDKLIIEAKELEDSEIFTVTKKSRDTLPEVIVKEVNQFIKLR
jgi:nucleoside-triphosphatase